MGDVDSWKSSFFKQAYLATLKSTDFAHREGACLVNEDNRMLSIGYNGLPRGVESKEVLDGKLEPTLFEVSAGRNAIFNAISKYIKGSDLYVGYAPCNTCAQAIIQTGIERVVYFSDRHLKKQKPYALAADVMFKARRNSKSRFLVSKYDGRTKLHLDDSISWDEKHMHAAGIAAKRSKDPTTKVGACLVHDTTEVASGYNGFPEILKGCDIPWEDDSPRAVHSKHGFVVHAEENTILNTSLGSIAGSTIYLTHFPDMKTMQTILQARVAKLVYANENERLEEKDPYTIEAAKHMANLAQGVSQKEKEKFDSLSVEEKLKHSQKGRTFSVEKADFCIDDIIFDLSQFI